jgi:hypothetical protein
MGRALNRLRLLQPTELTLHFNIALFILRIPSLLQLPLPRLGQLLEPEDALPEPSDPLREAERIHQAVGRVFRLEGRAMPRSCLTAGLASYRFMRRSGLDVALCFGVNKREVGGEAHCWLERNGQPFFEPVDPSQEFIEIYRFPPHLESPMKSSA